MNNLYEGVSQLSMRNGTHIKFDVFICNRFDVEADSWNGSDWLIQLQFVQDGYF